MLMGAAACASAGPPASPWAAGNPSWVAPAEPFMIADGVYYVGTKGLSSFLIATPEGLFLLDGGLPENAAAIAKNIEALGFSLRDVKYLLNSHAHFDHSGGLAALKAMTGAKL
ncbi:MAG TPA: subclass B3 metallo-beta-lactamase, partial [Parvularcula sp.]|nr:subclass B3 metallo-beta-lactamase [Parvularcula sp.]